MAFKNITPKKPINPAAVAAFGAGADATPSQAPGAPSGAGQGANTAAPTTPPDWQALDDKRRRPAFSLRTTDRENAQLQHIAATTPDSAHAFCMKAIKKALAEHFGE